MSSGQSKLLVKEKEERRESIKIKYNGEKMTHILPGLGTVEDYLAPAPGENISYRMWNLWCKEKPGSNLRMMIRSKVIYL